MMYKKCINLALVVLIIITNINISFAESNLKTLIIYENENTFSLKENKVNYLNELLYSFSDDISKVNIDEYKKGYINEFDYIFIYNIQDDISNKYIIEDLLKYEKNIYWIGNQIENLLESNNVYNLSYEKKNNNIHTIKYKGNEILIDDYDYFNIIKVKNEGINTENTVEIIATMSDGYKEYPYIIKNKNLYYISNYNSNQSYIFEDTLNDFYNINSFKEGEVFVKIEDVNLFRDKDKLKVITNYLYNENVPFMISLIPAYEDSKTGKLNTLDHDKEFIETIKYMQEKGGSVVLHGYSHSLDNKNNNTDYDLSTYVKYTALSGLRLCVENDIYPLAFEEPHYAMNIDIYKEIKKYFSTYIGTYQNNDEKLSNSTFPYFIKNSEAFNSLIPENLGFIEIDDELSMDIIKENFEKLSMVRGYTGGFSFNPDIDIKYLEEIIEYLKEKDVKFLDLKILDNYIKVDDINIASKNGTIDVNYDKDKSEKKSEEYINFEKNIKNLNKNIVIVISVVLILFICILILFRNLNRNKFKRR